MFLGNDLLAYLVLAVGGGLVAGSGMALVRPPADEETGRPPVLRTVVMIAVGGFASLWAVATLLAR